VKKPWASFWEVGKRGGQRNREAGEAGGGEKHLRRGGEKMRALGESKGKGVGDWRG